MDDKGRERTFLLRGRQVSDPSLRKLADYATVHGAVVGVWYPVEKTHLQ